MFSCRFEGYGRSSGQDCCVLSAGEGRQDGERAVEAGCEQREQQRGADMDPMKAQQLAAELEVEMMADMYNR